MQNMMGKRELNKARKREEIVEIATRSFFDHGYAATSMSAIAEALGGSKATLWAHFGSKAELFTAVIDRQVESFSRDIGEVLINQRFSLPALRRACLRFLDCLLREDAVNLFRVVMCEGERFPEIAEAFYSRGPATVRKCVVDLYTTAFAPPDAERLAGLTMAAMTGFRADILLRAVRAGNAEREAFVDSVIGLINWPEQLPPPA